MGLNRTSVRSYAGTLVQKIHKKYDKKYLKDDPIYFVHQYQDPRDQEVAGLICALLAFGNAKSIQNSTGKILKILGVRPYQTILNFDPKKYSFDHLGHRWIRGADIKKLSLALKKVLKKYDSIKNLFLKGYKPFDPNISNALHLFSQEMKDNTHYFLFPSPQDGSPCKRLNMFLRWMVRPKDEIDLGLWKEIPTSKLIVPLDTHIYQFARRFQISRYKNPNWKMAVEVTQFLKTLDPEDPIKFDFAICHYGMIRGWDGLEKNFHSRKGPVAQKISKTPR